MERTVKVVVVVKVGRGVAERVTVVKVVKVVEEGLRGVVRLVPD